MTPGQRLSARLTEIGWTQTRLARETGADESLVSRWVSDERTPTLDKAVAIARSEVAIPVDAWVDLSRTG